jgi:hypothetical protein
MYVKRIQAKYKKLLLELEFLYSDLEYHEDIMAEAIVEFQKAVMLYCKNNNINYEKDLVKNEEQRPSASDPESVRFYDEDGNPTDEDIRETENKPKDEEIRKIFKKIATKTHPDKFSNAKAQEKSLNKQIFLQAKEAAEDNNMFKLHQIARRLGIELPEMSTKQIKLMEKEAKNVRIKVSRIQKTLAWVWFDQQNEQKRQRMVDTYIKRLTRK